MQDAARGVDTEKGETHRADRVISAADAHHTIYEMLGGNYIDQKWKDRFEGRKPA